MTISRIVRLRTGAGAKIGTRERKEEERTDEERARDKGSYGTQGVRVSRRDII